MSEIMPEVDHFLSMLDKSGISAKAFVEYADMHESIIARWRRNRYGMKVLVMVATQKLRQMLVEKIKLYESLINPEGDWNNG